MTNAARKLLELGQSIWYDNIERRLLANGELAGMVGRGEIRGVTSNPSIFNKAIAQSSDYDEALLPLAAKGLSVQEIYESLAISDIQAAADVFRSVYEESGGDDGYVSLEVSPYLAHDTDGTCQEAARLWEAVNRPNLMIKIPATEAGLPAIRRTIAAGINVNVTLIFSQKRYEAVMDAYMAGLEDRCSRGLPIDHIASVASFFVSRIDTKVDGWLQALAEREPGKAESARQLAGHLAIANARLAYQKFKQAVAGSRFRALQEAGARLQRPLWASTSTKNPAYSDVVYVESLIGPHTVNTVPPKTLAAFLDHGEVRLTLETGLDAAEEQMTAFEALGFSFGKVTDELEAEGVQSFADAFTALLDTIRSRSHPA